MTEIKDLIKEIGNQISDPALERCPRCGGLSRAVRQYITLSGSVCIVIAIFQRTTHYHACPRCALRRIAWNVLNPIYIIGGNILWFIGLFLEIPQLIRALWLLRSDRRIA